MTIVSSTTEQSALQADNTYKIKHIHTDQLGFTYETGLKRVPFDFDIQADQDQSAIDTNTDTINMELLDAINDASRQLPVDRVPDYQTQPDFDRRLLGRFMTISDVYTFYYSLDFFLAVESRGGANAVQRSAYLGIPLPEYNLIADRYGDTQGVSFYLDDSKGQVWHDLPPAYQ